MRRSSIAFCVLLLVLLPAVLFAEGGTEKPATTNQPVTLVWYMPGGSGYPYANAQPVYNALNAMLEKDLGMKLDLKVTGGFGEFNTKMPLAMAAGTNFDIVFTSDWCNDFYNAVSNGYYAPLNNLLPQYAPSLWNDEKSVMGAVTVNGKILAIPNQQIWANTTMFILKQSDITKFGWDPTKIKSPEGLGPYLSDIQKNEPGIIPVSTRQPLAYWMMPYLGYDGLGIFQEELLAVRINDPSMKVFNLWEDPQFLHYVQLERDWYLKGYVAKDGATYSDAQWRQLYNAGRIGIDFHNTYKPADTHPMFGYGESADYPMGKPMTSTSNIVGTMEAISANSAHKADAVKLIEYLYTHAAAYNLLAWGISGTNYTTNSDGTINPLANSGYYPDMPWAFGNAFLSHLVKGQPIDANAITRKWNKDAAKSVILGFGVNLEPIKGLVASISAVNAQYDQTGDGYYDLNTVLPKYQAALKKAGIDQLIQEVQAQIDAWKKSQQ